jgi:hypothetical protein
LKGKVSYIIENEDLILKEWKDNSYFGDIEIFLQHKYPKRICSAKAFTNCDIFILNKKHIFTELKGKKEKNVRLIYKLFKRTAKERLKKLKLSYTNGMLALKQLGMNDIE